MTEGPELGLVLWTTDIPAVTTLLEQAGGLRLLQRHPGFAELEAGGGRIVLHSDDDAYKGHPWFDALRKEGAARGIGAEVRIRVADVDAAYNIAVRLGALAVQKPSDVGDAYECQVMGPDGFLLSFWEGARPLPTPPAAPERSSHRWPTRPASLRRP
jgi:hypothetical protein